MGKEVGDRLNIRITEQQRKAWQAAADRVGWTLSQWLRYVADAAARKG